MTRQSSVFRQSAPSVDFGQNWAGSKHYNQKDDPKLFWLKKQLTSTNVQQSTTQSIQVAQISILSLASSIYLSTAISKVCQVDYVHLEADL